MRTPSRFLAAILVATFTSTTARAASGEWTPPTLVPAPSPPTAELAVPTAEPAAEPSAAPRTKKRCTRGKKRCGKRRKPRVDPRLVESAAIRDQVLSAAAPLAAGGRHEDAAQIVSAAAASRADPILYLAAAELKLTDQRPDPRKLDEAISMTREAERLVLNPVDLRIATDVGPGLIDHGHQLASFATNRHQAIRLHRRGRGQTAVGGVLLGVGLSGIGMLASGAVFIARIDRSETAYTGSDATYLTALETARNRAETTLAAGLVTALVGTAIGLPLTVLGARDRRRAREAYDERPRLKIAPTLTGIAVSGRF